MKVYGIPAEVPAYEPDYANYDFDREQAAEDRHMGLLKQHLLSMGYSGKNTGEVVRWSAGDGYANYMFAESVDGKQALLIHLPYGDAWQSPMASRSSKTQVLKDLAQQKKHAAFFAA